MKLSLDESSAVPIFQQVVDQLHFAINTGKLKPGDKLPSIRKLARDNDLAVNTAAKALRQLEFRGVVVARDRSGYLVAGGTGSRYQARGVRRGQKRSA
ncbi:MAG: GntR family transcriptional regulator [Gammaproteobacteria bacterium]|nr:GntR family transcriptional regulator [Gammaproteobacteria bacterium]